MLRYLPHHQINFAAWDECVAASEQRIIYAFSWYLNSVCRQWDAIVEEQEGVYHSVFPLPLQQRFGQLYCQQPFFTQQLGLFTTTASKVKEVAPYLQLVPDKYNHVHLQLNTRNSVSGAELPAGYKQQERVTYHLSLQPVYKELLRQYSTNQKRNIKKADKAFLQVIEANNIARLISLFRATKGKELQEVKSKHYKLLARLYKELEKQQAAELLEVRNVRGDVLAAALLVHQPGMTIFLFGASSEAGKQHGAMAFLLDSCIRKYAGSNRVLDFEGSMVASVAKFYANFGASPVTYVSLIKQNRPWYLPWKNRTSTS